MKVKPVVKWAGGKRQILPELLKHFPPHFNDYHEPFIGGASVALELWNRGLLLNKNIYISDIMHPLINLYNNVKNSPEELIQELGDSKYANNAEAYNTHRSLFNDVKGETSIRAAALFLYLNRVCFNGMYRENSRGEYNVPFGKQSNPLICNKDSITALHCFLNNNLVHLTCTSFLSIENNVKPGDFVYMDPPYHNTFTKYNRESFGDQDQTLLRDMFVRLTERGCKVALSNSDFPFVRDLYKDIPGIKIIEISSRRMINCRVESRENVVTELLICNY